MSFGGETFDPDRDEHRLAVQLDAVRRVMIDGRWRTLGDIEEACHGRFPQASISARLRDLRKPQFGHWTVERRYVARGLWQYRVLLPLGQGVLPL